MFLAINPTNKRYYIAFCTVFNAMPVAFLSSIGWTSFRKILLYALVLLFGISYTHSYGANLGKTRFKWDAVDDSRLSGYVIYWGTESGIYNRRQDVGDLTDIIIEDFTEGHEYFAAVTAYDGMGVESDYSSEISFVYDSIDKIILLEAEEGVLSARMQTAGDGSLMWVTAPSSETEATVNLNFSVPYTAEYFIWCRVLAPSVSSDTLFVSIDSGMEMVYNVYGDPSPPLEIIKSEWTWSRIQIYSTNQQAFRLENGLHNIRFRNFDSVPLDRVVIASDPDFVPTDLLPRSGDYIEIIKQPQDTAVIYGGNVKFDASIISTGPVNFQWMHNGVAILNALQSTLSLSNVDTQSSGEYSLLAVSGTASGNTNPVILTVYSTNISDAFRVLEVAYLQNGQVDFTTTGSFGEVVEVYASDDLLNWNLISVQSSAGNTISIIDSGSGVRKKRFYRLACKASP